MAATECLIGLDLGQVRDPSAIAVLERVEEMGGWDPVLFGRPKKVALVGVPASVKPLGTAMAG